MSTQMRCVALSLLCALGFSLLAPRTAHAGKSGRRNTAVVLGAAAVYGVVKKKPVLAGAAGAGAIYSYVRSKKSSSRPRRYHRARRGKVRHVHHVHHVHHKCHKKHRHHDCDDDD